MKNTENIEKLFKETFEHFEADVNPQVWANIQSGINSGLGGTASTAAKFAIGKIIAGAATVAVVAGSVWYFASNNNRKINSTSSNNKKQTEATSKDISQNILSENQLAENSSNTQRQKQMASSAHTSNPPQANNSQQIQNVFGSNDNVTSTGFSSSDNSTTPSQSEHKYGKGSDTPTSLIRGSQIQNSKSKSSKDNSTSSDDQDADQPPTATIFASTESGDAPLTVTFSNQGIASSLSWDFGDGSASRENFPSHVFDKSGIYVVTLNAKNSSGSVSDNVTIEVRQISDITNIPNIFTPNGDGENDMFFFEMKNISSIGVAIYSQKEGGLVCKWNSLDGSWNGKKMSGDDAPEGVYIYSIQAIGIDGVPHYEKGTITLIRKP